MITPRPSERGRCGPHRLLGLTVPSARSAASRSRWPGPGACARCPPTRCQARGSVQDFIGVMIVMMPDNNDKGFEVASLCPGEASSE